MGQEPEAIKKEIDATREELGRKVDALTSQLGQTVGEAKTKGVKVAAAVGAALLAIVTLKKLRNR